MEAIVVASIWMPFPCCLFVRPLQTCFEPVEVAPCDLFRVLESPCHDTWRDAVFVGKSANIRTTETTLSHEFIPGSGWNKKVSRPLVGFSFNCVGPAVRPVDIHVFFAMQDDMRCFVKQAEP